ncbi:2-dehydro-3-deoxy-6-phosphogalactonate aldolase [Klebsiella michiganensis]|nr:2-dehydro-3-deoxy-6-phosphogalactonate aldolase [Klebsiella michiganensis]
MTPEQFSQRWQAQPLPFVAILRGITPKQASEAAGILRDNGFRYLEVPLNSPSPYESIKLMRDVVGDEGYVGAGTVLTVEQVNKVARVGGQLIISPNCDPDVIRHSQKLGLISLPGVMTPSEAFNAIVAGACALKLFPAEQITPATLKAYRAVLPAEISLLPVGGIQPDVAQMQSYLAAGANGFGLGGGLYQKNMPMTLLRERAQAYRQAWRDYVA